MKQRFTTRQRSIVAFSAILMTLLFAFKSENAFAQPTYVHGSSQSTSLCENSVSTDITSFLSISDPVVGSTETWSVISAPTNGSLSGFPTSVMSTGGTVTPGGLSYTPTAGYSGTDAFTIQVTNGTVSVTTTINVTVNPLPTVAAITGTASECVGGTTTLSDATSGGFWFSSNTAIATVNAGTGQVFGVSGGSVTIIYSVSNAFSCTALAFATDNVLTAPTVSAITGTTTLCVSTNTTLSDATSGGSWSSGNTGIATVNSSGVVTGVSSGSTNIFYSVTNSCGTTSVSTAVTVIPSGVAPITGASSVCAGSSVTLSDVTGGGSWSSADPSIATVNSLGMVTGLSGGSTSIVYTVTNACGTILVFHAFTVNTVPAAPSSITGASSVCAGSTTTLSSATSGGTWSSVSTSFATINASGMVTGVAVGSSVISYTVTNGCGSTAATTTINVVTVPTLPAAITGTTAICTGSTSTLVDGTFGGTWSSVTTSVATIDATGLVTSVAAGTSVISYTVSNACGSNARTTTVTVTAPPSAPAAITGTTTVCVGAHVTLFDATGSGTWSSADVSFATINASGMVTGVSAGSVLISYTLSNFCGATPATTLVTINTVPAAPAAISGTTALCVGASVTLTDATSGGTWTSVSTGVATITALGRVTGVTAGTSLISYTSTNSCGSTATTTTVTVSTVPSPLGISGTASICTGSTSALSDGSSGGVWSSTNPGVATIDAGGTVYGVSSGSTTISYTLTNACGSTAATRTVTVTAPPAAPAAIGGASSVCVPSSITLTDATGSGVWSSTNTAIATISATGVLTGVSGGVVTISYTSTNFCGSTAAITNITVISGPSSTVITGTASVCIGAITTLSDATGGGVWASGNASIATVDATGIVTGVAAGSAVISYTLSNACGSTTATRTVTVSAPPSTPPAMFGLFSVCVPLTTTLNDATGGGVWSSNDNSIATVNAVGMVTGVSAGSTTITYTVSNTCGSAFVTHAFTVNTIPAIAAISGPTTACVGGTITLTDATGAGAWTSATPSKATVNASGVVTGVAVGSATISYSLTNGCGTNAATTVITVGTVPATPAVITGTSSFCAGTSVTLSDATSGGTWSSTVPAIATVDVSGMVIGVAAGSSVISYTMTNSCGTAGRAFNVTITTVPVIAAIGGTVNICVGSTSTLNDATGGGTWTTSNAAIATVNAGGGVRGVAIGSADITYTVSNTCGPNFVTRTVNIIDVPAAPPAITGTMVVCAGSTTTLFDATSGGTWSSATMGTATVNSSGVVTGVAAGIATISYSVSNSCGLTATTASVTVNTTPSAPAGITGTTVLCIGATSTLSDVTSSGVWSTANPSVATIDASGMVTAIATGSAIISYTISNSCGPTAAMVSVSVITVPGAPAGIGGTATVCAGSMTTLTDATGSGVWSSANTATATVNATGGVTGVAAGIVAISYTVSNTCGSTSTTRNVTVITTPASPAAITGTTTVCVGSDVTLSDATSSGAWSSTSTTNATISGTGVVHGVAVGSTTISYTVSNSCGPTAATVNVNVITVPTVAPITGVGRECIGSTAVLNDATSGGTWFTSDVSIATVNSTGTVTGVSAGTVLIVYSVSNVCGTSIQTFNDTVSTGVVTAITGTTNVCVTSTTTLSNATAGGTWTSSNIAIATVNSTGVVTGVATGSCTITYSVTNSCGVNTSTATITVENGIVAAITGTMSVCVAAQTTLADATAGGVWASSTPSTATVDAAGVVTGVAAGTATIAYTLTNSCGVHTAFASVTVNPLPVPGSITGIPAVCPGAVTFFSDATGGAGVWSSSNTAIATVNSTGAVTGVAAGSAIISYGVTNGCGTLYATQALTVNPLPSAASITGTDSVCVGATTTFSDATSGGIWNSSATAVATVSATGVITGVSAGTSTITYSVTNVCGTADSLRLVTVNALPVPGTISGTTTVCVGSATLLSDTPPGGSWSSSASGIASVDPASGIVSGISAGTANITYTAISHGCTATTFTPVTIVPIPNAGLITGLTTVCVSASTLLSDAAGGGVWTSSDNTIATVTGFGLVTGVAAGSVTISYTVSNVCGTSVATASFTVNPLPNAGSISGPASVCVGSSITLTDAASGGVWSSSSSTTATVSTTGVVTGVAAGSANIFYSVTNGCGTAAVTTTITVNPLPVAGTISGSTTVCQGSITGLSSSAGGGVWTSGSTPVATVDASGNVSGVTGGAVTISYSVTNVCGTAVATFPMTVIALPVSGSISGPTEVCVGASISLSDPAPGGVWSSTSLPNATVSLTGVVSGLLAGSTTINYTVTNVCGISVASYGVTINPLPIVIVTPGSAAICNGGSTTMDATGASTYNWSPATGLSAVTGTPVTCNVTSTTTYTITGTSALGCVSTTTQTITVNPLPILGTTVGSAAICIGNSTTINATGASTYSWTPSADLSSSTGTPVTATPTVTTTYTITGTSGFGCVSTTTRTITVNPLPPVTASSGAAAICTGSSTTLSGGGASTYTWSPGTGLSATTGAIVTCNATATTTYTVTGTSAAGCVNTATVTITVNPLPPVTLTPGSTSICSGSSTTLMGGGAVTYTWSPGTGLSATTGTIVTCNTTTTRTYTVTGTDALGCSNTATQTITVNALPTLSTTVGSAAICIGGSTTIGATGAVTYTWVPGTSLSATTGTPVTATPTVTTTYTITGTNAAGCVNTITRTITVNALPTVTASSGSSTICIGSSTTLSGGGATTYSWSPGTGLSATTGSPVTCSATTTTTYTVTGTNGSGCQNTATVTITVNPIPTVTCTPSAVSICNGSSTTLTGGGGLSYTWSPGTGLSATTGTTVTTSTTTTRTYTVTGTNSFGCTATATGVVTVNALPVMTTSVGSATICSGSSTTMGAGGASTYTWSPGTGLSATTGTPVTASPTITTTYTVTGTTAAGCSATATRTITVNAVPTVTVTASSATICSGVSTTLTGGGATTYTWSPGTGLSATTGAVVICNATTTTVYTVTGTAAGCSATAIQTITVTPLPNAGTITGASTVCVGADVTLSETVGSGTWSSSATGFATISATGVVHGVAVGSTTISYAVTNACGTSYATYTVTVNALPNAGTISGATTVCSGSVITLTSSGTSGGIWTSISGTGSATVVAATGAVTGGSAGTDTIRYTVTTATCGSASANYVITVNPLPNAGAITGVSAVCTGQNVTLTDGATGGTWSTGVSGHVTVSSTGVVTGVSAGLDTVFYTVTNSCGTAVANHPITDNPIPVIGLITGVDSVCVGVNITLSDSTVGGTWSSVTMGVATVTATGVVHGVGSGTSVISYSKTVLGCTGAATLTVRVDPVAAGGAITGPGSVCVGSTISLGDATAVGTGTWSSTVTSVATIDASGTVYGVSAGTTSIVYSVTNNCSSASATRIITVNPIPTAGTITGSAIAVCPGFTMTLTDVGGTAGGGWSSSATSVATVNSSGVVFGVSGGTATITYHVITTCGDVYTTTDVTINPAPDAGTITGAADLCVGSTLTLSDAATSGGWSSSSTSVATVDAFGVVTGVSPGTTNIVYTVTNICGTATTFTPINVFPVPDAGTITGPTLVCGNDSIHLGNATATTGGTWSTGSYTAIATINASTGWLYGVSGGTATVTYTVTSTHGCGSPSSYYNITVNPAPYAGVITTGTPTVCVGFTILMSDATTGGTWGITNTSMATISGIGVVTGVIAGVDTVTYSVTNSCGTAVARYPVTINPAPSAGTITGPSSVCPGALITLSDAVTSGTWSSGASSIATITSGGVVHAIASGTVTISYSVTTVCGTAVATRDITVNPLPYAGTITGPDSVCRGTTILLGDGVSGGVWTSGTAAVGTVSSGIVTGVNAGTTTISYAVTNVCGTAYATKIITVNPHLIVAPITGTSSLCLGSTYAFTDAVAGGAWTASNGNVTVSATGFINTFALGSDTILYSHTDLCGTSASYIVVTVNSVPDVGTITSSTNWICQGNSVSLIDTVSGGYWTSSMVSIATVSSTGVVTGVTPGEVVVTYNLVNFCGSSSDTMTITVYSTTRCLEMLGTANTPKITEVSVYPNPVSSVLHIEAPEKVNVSILSIDGKLVMHQDNAENMDVSGLADGMYMVMIYDTNNALIKTAKFVKNDN